MAAKGITYRKQNRSILWNSEKTDPEQINSNHHKPLMASLLDQCKVILNEFLQNPDSSSAL